MAAAATMWGSGAAAQQHPERRHIRQGNRHYEAERYEAAEERLRTALEKNPSSFEASFNLFDALYKQGRYEEAVTLLEQTAQNPLLTPDQKAKVFHNLGNGMFSMQKLQEAADYYKQSLRENPDDLETKYNLAYVQKLLEDQNKEDNRNQQDQNNGQSDQNQNSRDKDNRGDTDGEDSQDGEQEGQDGDKNQPNKENGDGQQGNEPPKPDPRNEGNGIKREDAQSILDAMQQQEDKTREKVKGQRAKTVGRSGKNW